MRFGAEVEEREEKCQCVASSVRLSVGGGSCVGLSHTGIPLPLCGVSVMERGKNNICAIICNWNHSQMPLGPLELWSNCVAVLSVVIA